MAVNASWARNSAVTSTTVEAVASDHETPCSVTARAPNTKPPTCENGRQLAEASRTMRPQIEHPGAAGLARRRDRVPGQAQHDEQHELPADDQREIRPADAAARRRSRGRSRTSRSGRCRAAGQPGQARSRASSRRRTFRLADGAGGRLYTDSAALGYMLALCSEGLRRGSGRSDTADRCDRLRRLRGRAGAGGARPSAAPAGPAHQRPAQPGGHRRGAGAGRPDRRRLAGARGRRLPLRVPRRGRLSVLGARSRGDAARQCRRHAGGDAGGAGGGGRAHRALQFGRGAGLDGRRHAGRRDHADQRGGLHRHLQALEVPGRAGGAGSGAPGGAAGGGGQSRPPRSGRATSSRRRPAR